MNFSAVVNGLSAYVDQIGTGEIIKVLAGSAPSIKYLAKQGGVNQPTDIHMMDVQGAFGDGKNCTLNDNTSFTFTDRKLVPAIVKQESVVCANELIGKWLSYNENFTVSNESVPFEQAMLDAFVRSVGDNLETAIWKGTNINSVVTKGFCDIISEEGVKVKAGASASVYDQLIAAVKGIPSKFRGKVELFVSPLKMIDIKNELLKRDVRLTDLNFTNGTEVDENTIKMPVFGTLIHEVSGIADTDDAIYGLVPEHAVYGYSVNGENVDAKVIYDDVNDRTIFRAKLAIATQVAYPSETIYVTRTDA